MKKFFVGCAISSLLVTGSVSAVSAAEVSSSVPQHHSKIGPKPLPPSPIRLPGERVQGQPKPTH